MKIRILVPVVLIVLCNDFLSCNCDDDNKEYLTVVSSKLLKIGKPYQVSIHHQGYITAKTLQIGIAEISSDKFELVKNITIIGDGTESLEFVVSIYAKNGNFSPSPT